MRAVLDAGHAVVVLEAPRGYGKSALVSHWLRQRELEAVWHSTVPGEGEHELWTGLLVALDPEVQDPRALDPASAYRRVREHLEARTEPLTLVVDHAERLADDVEARLVEVLERAPAASLVVCTHPRGPSALIAHFGVDAVVVSTEQLSFTLEEVATLAAALGSPLGERELTEVHAALWGWPAPTRTLLTASAASEESSIDWSVLAQYLDSVHTMLDADAEDFFFETSVLDHLTAHVAQRLTGNPRAAALLVAAERAGLARSEAAGGARVYRYLPAVAKAIEAGNLALPGVVDPSVHQRAVAVLEHMPESAIQHAAAAEDWDQVLEITNRNWIHLVVHYPTKLQKALAKVPQRLLAARPRLLMARDILLNARIDTIAAVPIVWPEPGTLPSDDDLFDIAGVAVGQVIALRGSFQYRAAAALASRLTDTVRDEDGAWRRSMVDFLPFVLVQTGVAHLVAGDLDRAQHDLQQAQTLGTGTALEFLARNACEYAALIDVLRGDMAVAVERLEQAESLARPPAPMRSTVDVVAPLVRAGLAIDRLDLDEAARQLDAMPTVTQAQHFRHSAWFVEPLLRTMLTSVRGGGDRALVELTVAFEAAGPRATPASMAGRILASLQARQTLWTGNPTRARNLMEHNPVAARDSVLRAQLALREGEPDVAVAIVTTGLWRSGVNRRERLALILEDVHARHALGLRDQAVDALRRAVEVAGPDAPYSFATADRAVLADLADEVVGLGAILARIDAAGGVVPSTESARIIDLSERELAVLVELETTVSTELVAKHLFVSVNTVKSQVRSLYRKLGVSSREAALAEGYRLGYLGLTKKP